MARDGPISHIPFQQLVFRLFCSGKSIFGSFAQPRTMGGLARKGECFVLYRIVRVSTEQETRMLAIQFQERLRGCTHLTKPDEGTLGRKLPTFTTQERGQAGCHFHRNFSPRPSRIRKLRTRRSCHALVLVHPVGEEISELGDSRPCGNVDRGLVGDDTLNPSRGSLDFLKQKRHFAVGRHGPGCNCFAVLCTEWLPSRARAVGDGLAGKGAKVNNASGAFRRFFQYTTAEETGKNWL